MTRKIYEGNAEKQTSRYRPRKTKLDVMEMKEVYYYKNRKNIFGVRGGFLFGICL